LVPIVLLLLITLSVPMTLVAQPLSTDRIANHIEQSIDRRIKGDNRRVIKQIYASRAYRPLWVGYGQSKRASDLIQALNNPLFNYKNKLFDQTTISRLYYMLDNGQISQAQKVAVYARLDLVLTSSMVRLVRFIVQGDVDWSLVQSKMRAIAKSDDIHATWEMQPKAFPPLPPLIASIEQGEVYSYLYALLPMKRRYLNLVKLLKRYRVMEKSPQIPYSHTLLKVGSRSKRVSLIKKRLQITGDYPRGASVDNYFSKALEQAIIRYQKRYLLKPTGAVDTRVTYYMNQPISKNVQAIITNLDKTKLYPSDFEAEYAEVNVPDFNLRYYLNGNIIYKTGVVVGRIDRPTPIFSDKIDYMVINPTWTIPNNLIKRDLIPVLQANPNYLEENNIHAFLGNKEVKVTAQMLEPYQNTSKGVPYRFIQYPGDSNALGRVKFMFPNKYAVYLHDTDNKSLHERRYKVYSSGCVRVDRPFELVNILLRYTKGSYTQERMEEILATNQPHTIRLIQSIPVHIVYFTVFEEGGLAYFKNDIYLYDKMIEESTQSNRKLTFTIPEKRMVSIKKRPSQPMSN
jgi:murein L,D-transpeptidase YcbB/YkuD